MAPNHEWLKILVSSLTGAGAGFVAGLIAEPIKAKMQWRATATRARRAVAHDVIMLFIGRNTVKVGLVSEANFWLHIELPGFQNVWEKNRDYFYDDLGLITQAQWLRAVMLLKAGVADGRISMADASVKLDNAIEELMKIHPRLPLGQRVMVYLRTRRPRTSASQEEKATRPDFGPHDAQ